VSANTSKKSLPSHAGPDESILHCADPRSAPPSPSQAQNRDTTCVELAYRTTEVRLTLRWRGLDSNFQYAGAVNLVVAPFMPPKARDGSVRSLSFRTARRPASKRRGPDRRGRNPCRRRTAPNFAWSGKKTATPYRVTAPADPSWCTATAWAERRGRSRSPFSSPSGNLIWSVAISTRSMAFSGSAPPTVAGGPGFCGTWYCAAQERPEVPFNAVWRIEPAQLRLRQPNAA